MLSGDSALLEACESGDVYLGVAQQLGFLPDSLNEAERKAVRALFKTVVLGIQYGLGLSLARCPHRHFVVRGRRDPGALAGALSPVRGLRPERPRPCRPAPGDRHTVRLVDAMPVRHEPAHRSQFSDAEHRQRNSARDLRAGGAARRSRWWPPVHDAIMAEGPADQAEELSAALDQVMGDAAAVVLRGYRLPTDCQIIRPGERYFDDRGKAMWDTVTGLLAKLGAGDGVMGTDIDNLFEDVENDPLWQMAGLLADAPPRPAEGYVTVSLAWLARVLPVVRTPTHLVVAMLIYRECLVRRSNTVALSNGELRKLGISRYAKYRALAWLHEAGVIAIEKANTGRSVRVTLALVPVAARCAPSPH